ncbi:DegT/DnrJ/EryC1/StrS family aminotransferase, partial [Campylobacter coli]
IEMQKLENESQKIMSDEQKYLKILNNMKLNQARFDYNDKLWHKPIKACVIMHTFGLSAHIKAIKELCEKYHILLIEDAAEALG